MYLNSNWSCCGVREIAALFSSRSAEGAMRDFISEIKTERGYGGYPIQKDKFRYAVFTGTVHSRAVPRFAAFIEANNLGEVICTGFNVNPNSNNRLKVYVWTVDHDAVQAWGKKNGKRSKSAKAAPSGRSSPVRSGQRIEPAGPTPSASEAGRARPARRSPA